MYGRILSDIKSRADPARAGVLSGFFKTGPGEYAEGDRFWGVTVPESRRIAKEHEGTSWRDIERLLESAVHEVRLVGWLILVERFRKAKAEERGEVYAFYMKHRSRANNWDLVDLTADKIAGAHLMDKDKAILYELSGSKSVWDRRIAIVSTFYFIKAGRFGETLRIAAILAQDQHDLIQKAVGWMLREVGKRELAAEERFLRRYHRTMPRTMLRYAIERFPEAKRRKYMG